MAQKEKNKLENIDLSTLSDKEKRDLILSMRRLGGKKGSQKRSAPTTDDELWDWIKCAKPGSLVRIRPGKRGTTTVGIPIEQLEDMDEVISFSGKTITGPRKIKTNKSFYNGLLYNVKASGYNTWVTPNHKWPVKYDEEYKDNFFAVYLMKKGSHFRVGKTKFFTERQGTSRIGLQCRLAGEQANCAWLLKLFSSEAEALLYERYVSCIYGIPEVLFVSTKTSKMWYQDNIDKLYNMLDDIVQLEKVKKCLQDHGRDIRFPNFTRGPSNKRERYDVYSINIIPEIMEIPIAGNRYDKVYWRKIDEVGTEQYIGQVYSLEVEQYHKYIQDEMITCNSELGYEIPRVAVCDDHTAPFDYVADYIFERYKSILVLGGRESAKTLNTSIAHFVNSEIKPGCESCTFANIEQQSNKSYTYVKSFLYTKDDTGKKVIKSSIDGEPLRKETRWKSGSKIEILIGTVSGVNSPHPQKVHADEVDLLEDAIWEESRNMASSKKLSDGSEIKAQNIATSTLKSTKGIMQKLMDESAKAEKLGLKPTWKVYKSCIYEVAEEVPSCRMAPQDKREARLIELEKEPCELCECNKIVKGEWSEGVPRTLDSVCKGKLFKSRGWMAFEDVAEKFVQNTPNKWASQLECRRPMADGLYLPTWSRDRYVVRDYEPRPEFGYIWMGCDWGGSANSTSAITWIQGPLHQPIQVNNFQGTKTLIPQGAYVIFKEIYEAAIGATRLADKVVRQEIQYKSRYGAAWRVKGRFADKAGAQQRADWREHNPPLRTHWYLSGKYFDPTVECVQSLVSDSLLYADGTNAPGICDDFESWRSENGKEVHDESSHGPSSVRYCLKNVQGIVKRYNNPRQTLQPVVAARDSAVNPTAALVGVGSPSSADYSSEKWRESLGQEIGGNNAQGGKPDWMP